MNIKSIITDDIRYDKLEKALFKMQVVTPFSEDVESITIQFAKIKAAERQFHENTITRDIYETEKGKVIKWVLNIVKTLPEDLELLKEKLKLILNDYSITIDTIDLLKYLIIDDTLQNILNSLVLELSELQESEREEGDKYITDRSKAVKDKIDKIINNIQSYHLSDDWNFKFVKWLIKKREQYVSIPLNIQYQLQAFNYHSIIADITQDDENHGLKGKFFNWLELYLTEEFDAAYSLLIDIREQSGIGSTMFYEFLLITSLNRKSFKNNIEKVLIKGNLIELKRLLFYVERIRYNQKGRNEFNKNIVLSLLKKVANIIQRVYLNIAHNYFETGTSRGRSKQRDIIKRCIEVTSNLYDSVEDYDPGEEFIDLIETLLLELDNAGKFPWTDVKNKNIINTTVFDALKYRDQFLNTILSRDKHIDSIINELTFNINELQKNGVLEKVVRDRFIRCCMINYYNYEDQRFIELTRKIGAGQVLKSKSFNRDTDSHTHEDSDDVNSFLKRHDIIINSTSINMDLDDHIDSDYVQSGTSKSILRDKGNSLQASEKYLEENRFDFAIITLAILLAIFGITIILCYYMSDNSNLYYTLLNSVILCIGCGYIISISIDN